MTSSSHGTRTALQPVSFSRNHAPPSKPFNQNIKQQYVDSVFKAEADQKKFKLWTQSAGKWVSENALQLMDKPKPAQLTAVPNDFQAKSPLPKQTPEMLRRLRKYAAAEGLNRRRVA